MTGVNPVVDRRQCWRPCRSCWKCEDQGRYSQCATCPAQVDILRRKYPDPDAYCDCHNGILRHRTQKGQLIIRKFLSSPYEGRVQTDAISEDERDWNTYVAERREFLNNPQWDPVQYDTGAGVTDWANQHRMGRGW